MLRQKIGASLIYNMLIVFFLLVSFFSDLNLANATNSCMDTIAKNRVDTNGFGLTVYPYATGLKYGSIAYGPTFIINTHKRINFQIAFLVDFKKYKYSFPTHFGLGETYSGTNFFYQMLIHYNYLMRKKMNGFISSGYILGGKYISSNDKTFVTNMFNVMIGIGIEYKFIKQFRLRSTLTLRYNGELIFPGLQFDFTIPIKTNH
jgi:hypothetical protein